MRTGLWTGFFLLEEKCGDSLRTVLEYVRRIRNAGFLCGELDERSAFHLFVDCKERDCEANAESLAKLNFFTQLHAPKPVSDIEAQKLMEKRIVRACSIMGVRTVVTHPFVTEAGVPEPKDGSFELLKRFCDDASCADVCIALENQIYLVDIDFYLSRIPRLGVNIDFAHAVASGLDVPAMIERYGSRLYGLHVSDSDGRTEDFHIMPGRGILDWNAVFEKLAAVRYAGDLHLEIVHERSERPDANDRTAESACKTVTELMEAWRS